MGFWSWGKSPEFDSDVEVIAEACMWLQKMREKPFADLVRAIKQRGWEESYDRKEYDAITYGFFICNKKLSGHISERPRPERQLSVSLEAHEEYFGVMVSIHEHGIYADLKEASQKGKHAVKLRDALLRREGFTSLEQLKRKFLG